MRDRCILVTGASRGIGAETAVAFGRCGATVGVHYNSNLDGANEVCERVREAGGQAISLQGDLLEADVPVSLVNGFVSETGRIDVLVNNAGGIERHVQFQELTDSDWQDAMDLNARAPFRLSVAACGHMETEGFGRIINISTAAIKYAGANSVHYIAAKSAMEAVSSALARWGASRNILVNTIRCGLIDTGMRQRVAGYSEDAYRRRLHLVPVGRAGLPAEVAALVVFLASDKAAFVTREVWTIGGGD